MKKFDLQLFATDYLTNYGVGIEIDTTPTTTATYVTLGDGFDNLAEALNEVINQYQFLSKGGYGKSYVTGMQPVFTLTGIRLRADAAQNFIFGKKYEVLDERVTNLKITYIDGDGSTVVIQMDDVTMANIQEFGGNSTDGAAISVEFHTSEKPTVTVTP